MARRKCTSKRGPGSSGGPSESCSAAEKDAYAQCYYKACNTQLTQCYGAGYKEGTFTGPCGSYLTCANACDCTDTVCRSKCGQPSADCRTCQQGLRTCSSCTVPMCFTIPGGSSGSSGSSGFGPSHSCADLQACCAKIVDANEKATCEQYYTGAMNNESDCDFKYPAFAPYCP